MARERQMESGNDGSNFGMGQGDGAPRVGSEGSADDRIGVEVIREPAMTTMTPRKREICWNYGIPPRETPHSIGEGARIALRRGSIVLLTGPSGSGKSTILRAVADRTEGALWVTSRWPSRERPLVDSIVPRGSLSAALEILTACGLGEPRLWVRQFCDLSDGERFRAGLARAIGEAISKPARPVILCDEFAAILHRRLAKCLAHNLRKLVSRHQLTLVLATTHEDLVADLRPDQRIDLGRVATSESAKSCEPTTSCEIGVSSLVKQVVVEKGRVRDYELFSPMHYRHRDGLGFVDQVFLLRERPTGDALGVLVTAHAPLELSQRNACTKGRFIRNPRRLNRELRIIRRLVMHPDVRGCGLGHWFVRETLPRVGVRFVECLAAMGEVNPIFERAGMARVGRCPLPKGRMKLLGRLAAMKVDPFASDFAERVARTPRVRKMVEETVRTWAGAMHGNMRFKVGGRSSAQLSTTFLRLIGSPPVYYLWDRRGEFPMTVTDGVRDAAGSSARRGKRGNRSDGDPDTRRTTSEKDRHRPTKR